MIVKSYGEIMSDLKKKLGARIKEMRKNLGYSQEKLAEIINMDTPNLSNIECGKRFMTAETLEKIANALNTTERELFDFSNKNPEMYIKPDIKKFLDLATENDLKFFLDVLKSYFKYKK